MRKIIIIEDNPADAKTLRVAINRRDPTIEMDVFDDGATALKYFLSAAHDVEPFSCDLILLDLHLPHVSGFEVLEFLKNNAILKSFPVVVLSGSSSEQDIARCYASGANSYICKPTGIEQVFQMASQIITYWFDLAKRPKTASLSLL